MIAFNLTKRERALFLITVIAIAIWVGERWVVRPVWRAWNGLDEKIASSRLKLEKSERLVRREKLISRDYDKLASTARMAGSEEEEMARFLTEVEFITNSSGIRINEIKPLPVKKTETYRRFMAEVELEGEMSQISLFMRKIQDSTGLLSIDKLSLGAKQAGSNLLRCRIVVSKLAVL